MNIMFTSRYGGMNPYYYVNNNLAVISLAAIAISIILGTILYFTFMNKSNDNKFSGFIGMCYSFFNFKSFIFENVLKFFYILGFIFLTVYGLLLLFIQPVFALIILIGGNLGLRMTFEFLLSIFMIKDSGVKLDFTDEFLCDDENCDCCEYYGECEFQNEEAMEDIKEEDKEVKKEKTSKKEDK